MYQANLVNNKKIAFIVCTNSEIWYSECVRYLQELEWPDGYEVEILQIVEAKCMTAGYNEGMHSTDAKYKIYLHQDLFILRKDFIMRVIGVFISHPEIGIMGIMGTNRIVPDANYWNHWDRGQVFALDIMHPYKLNIKSTGEDEVIYAYALDGMILMTQYDVEWREDIFNGWDFYDISQCFEFRKSGYEVAILLEKNPSCLHDCGYSKLSRYDESREIFCNEYALNGFRFEKEMRGDISKEREELFERFLEYLNKFLQLNLEEARILVDGMYFIYQRDNRVATLKLIFNIFFKEQKEESTSRFIVLGDTWEELIEKYTRLKFLIRRVEFDVDENATYELCEELQMGRISAEAVEEIINHCCYNGSYIIKRLQETINT